MFKVNDISPRNVSVTYNCWCLAMISIKIVENQSTRIHFFRWNIPLNYNGYVECYMVVCLLQVLIKAIGRNCLIRKQLYLHQNITTKRLWYNIQIPLYNNMKSGRDNIKTINFSTSHCFKMVDGFSCCGCFLYTTGI